MARDSGRRPLRAAVRGCALTLVAVVLFRIIQIFLFGNVHTVLPGRIYRCAQPSAAFLGQLIARHHIRTIVNLRGCCAPSDWYLDECRVANEHGVSQEDVCFSAGRMPPVHELRHLVDILDHCEYPVLFHCQRGADRTGLASALALLLYTDTTVAEGRKQLSLRYGHLALGRPANLGRFFDEYEDWLREQDLQHSRAVFRRWAIREYCPSEGRCRAEVLERPAVERGQPLRFRVRYHNTALKPWCFHANSNAGVHAVCIGYDPAGNCVFQERAGLFATTVAPGEFIDLEFALPALHVPGRYLLRFDMIEEQQGYFYQLGSEPLEEELMVP